MNTRSGKDEPGDTASEQSVTVGHRTIPVRNSRIDSADLFRDGKEITIAHGAELYRLRLTAQNKLILTK